MFLLLVVLVLEHLETPVLEHLLLFVMLLVLEELQLVLVIVELEF